jgi:hypothetical protein
MILHQHQEAVATVLLALPVLVGQKTEMLEDAVGS